MKRVTNVKCYRTNDGRYFRASVINILVAIAIAFMLIAFIVFFSEVVIDDTMEFLLHMFLKTVICGGIGFVGYMILRWVGKTFWKTAPYHFRMIEELFFYIKKRKLYFYIFLFILVHHRGVAEPRRKKCPPGHFFNPPFRLPCIFLYKKKKTTFLYFSLHSGAPPGSRTPDLLIKSQLLYQLS